MKTQHEALWNLVMAGAAMVMIVVALMSGPRPVRADQCSAYPAYPDSSPALSTACNRVIYMPYAATPQ